MKNNKPNLTGLLFGSFNPVHIGHIAIAGYMKEFEELDEIWFIVSPRNPFKSQVDLADAGERLEMVMMAAKKHRGLSASDIEFGMPLPSYTLDTMKNLTKNFPEREFKIILGSDNLESIPLWKGGKTLMKDYSFLIYPRPGSIPVNRDKDNVMESTGNKPMGFNDAKITDAPVIDVSSTFIRESVAAGKDMRAFLPEGVYEYIVERNIYR